jgi:Holliday junction resolvase RusA-like endonuclease
MSKRSNSEAFNDVVDVDVDVLPNVELIHKYPAGISLVVNGKPIPQQRPRISRAGYIYNPSKDEQNTFSAKLIPFAHAEPLSGPLKVVLQFYFKRPLSHYGTGRNAATLKHQAPHWNDTTCDVDNLAKFVLDAMNTIIYHDDRQITHLTVTKVYTEDAERVEISVTKL